MQREPTRGYGPGERTGVHDGTVRAVPAPGPGESVRAPVRIRLVQGFPEEQRATVAALFWEAFSGKLGRLLSPRERALAFVAEALHPRFALSALDEGGRVVGTAGLKTSEGGLLAAGFADLAHAYGTAGALWRAPLLDLTERPAAPEEAWLDGLFVADSARGRGIGTRLIEAAAAEAAARGHTVMLLDVVDANARARALYESTGFRPVGERRMGLIGPVLGVRRSTRMRRDLASGSGA